jgi:DNA polymerase-3 subunit delta
MFSSKKAIIIRYFDKASQESQTNLVKIFQNHSNETGVFLTAETMDKRLGPFKVLKKIAGIKEYKLPYSDKIPEWLTHFSQTKFKRRLSYQAAQLLQEFIGDDLRELELELEKLSLTLKPGAQFTEEAIQSIVIPHRSKNIFEILKMMGLGKKGKALLALDSLLRQGEPAFLILIRLFNHYLKLLKTNQLKSAGVPLNDIANQIGLHPFLFKKDNYLRQSESRSPKKWQSLLAQISQLELDFKTGKYTQRHETEIAFAGLI